jgi:hypothetical protein
MALEARIVSVHTLILREPSGACERILPVLCSTTSRPRIGLHGLSTTGDRVNLLWSENTAVSKGNCYRVWSSVRGGCRPGTLIASWRRMRSRIRCGSIQCATLTVIGSLPRAFCQRVRQENPSRRMSFV